MILKFRIYSPTVAEAFEYRMICWTKGIVCVQYLDEFNQKSYLIIIHHIALYLHIGDYNWNENICNPFLRNVQLPNLLRIEDYND